MTSLARIASRAYFLKSGFNRPLAAGTQYIRSCSERKRSAGRPADMPYERSRERRRAGCAAQEEAEAMNPGTLVIGAILLGIAAAVVLGLSLGEIAWP